MPDVRVAFIDLSCSGDIFAFKSRGSDVDLLTLLTANDFLGVYGAATLWLSIPITPLSLQEPG